MFKRTPWVPAGSATVKQDRESPFCMMFTICEAYDGNNPESMIKTQQNHLTQVVMKWDSLLNLCLYFNLAIIWKTRFAEWWQTVIPLDGFFYPTLTRIIDSFSCSPLNTLFYNWEKTWKRLLQNHEYANMRYGDIILNISMTSQIHVRPVCGQRVALCFFLSLLRVR